MKGECAVVTQEGRPVFCGSKHACKDFVRTNRQDEGADYLKVVSAASVRTREVR